MSESSQIARDAKEDIILIVMLEKQWTINNDKRRGDLDLVIKKSLEENPEAANFFTNEDWSLVLDKSEEEIEELLELPEWQRKSHKEKIKSVTKSCREAFQRDIGGASSQ